MKRLKSILGFIWAILAIPIILATFMGMNFWAKELADVTGVKISPWFSGGEVARTISQEGYRTEIHEPVFQALLGERDEGFVQINWIPVNGKLPPLIEQEIDYDGDGTNDFRIHLDTRTNHAFLTPHSRYAISVARVLNLGSERAVRVRLLNRRISEP